MKRILSVALLLCITIFSLSSCKKGSDNSSHIPKDATAVIRVDMGSIGKKLAMDILFGSDLFKEMSKAAGKDSSNVKDIQNAGIDWMNTFYMYVTADQRFSGDQKFVGLLPLSDNGKWEAYVKKIAPSAQIKTVDKRKECLLDDGMYAAWDDNLLILTNTIVQKQNDPYDANGNYVAPQTDLVQTGAEINNIFKMTKENSIASNSRFSSMEKDGHDVSLWVNYESIMNNYGKGMMGGFTMSNAIFKDAAMVSGIDFDKGAINAEMKYYVSDEMKSVMKNVVNNNANKELVQMLPANNLGALAALSFSSKEMKTMLDKFGLIGMMNVSLAEANLTADDVFESITGDMGFSMNNFRVEQKEVPTVDFNEATGEMIQGTRMSSSPAMDWIYVIKIDKQDKFDKILTFATGTGMIVSTGSGNYAMANGGEDAPAIVVKDKYLVVANTAANANAYIAGTYKGQKLHEVAAKEVFDHPATMFADIKQMMTAMAPTMTNEDPASAAIFAEVQKTFDNVIFTGGEFKGDAFTYKASLNFINKGENSLLQLINLGSKISEIENRENAVAAR